MNIYPVYGLIIAHVILTLSIVYFLWWTQYLSLYVRDHAQTTGWLLTNGVFLYFPFNHLSYFRPCPWGVFCLLLQPVLEIQFKWWAPLITQLQYLMTLCVSFLWSLAHWSHTVNKDAHFIIFYFIIFHHILFLAIFGWGCSKCNVEDR